METTYAEIWADVVENGRIETWEEGEIEAEVLHEAGERGLTDEQAYEAVEWALTHIK